MKRKSVKRSARKVTRTKSRKSSVIPGFLITRRWIIVGVGAASFLLVFLTSSQGRLTQSVAGVSVARPLFAEATVRWEKVDGAVSYNLYYKQKGEGEFSNSVRNIESNLTHYTVSYLRKGVEYEYRLSAVDSAGAEYWTSGVYTIDDVHPM